MGASPTRREFLHALGLGAGGALLPRCRLEGWWSRKPNIVLLLTDDHRWDAMGCAGNPVIQTPNLDRLAAEGTRFANAFVTTSICPVSRVSILTGQYMRRHGIRDFLTNLTEAAMAYTYPALLRQAGYYTGFLGKWGIGDTRDAANRASRFFDYWAGTPKHGNYWHEASCPYITNDGVSEKTRNECTCPPSGDRPRTGRKDIKDPRHLSTEIIPAKFIQFLDSQDREKPFCIAVSFKAAHVPWSDWDPSLADLYASQTMPLPPSATREAAAQLPEFLRDSPSGGRGSDPDRLQSRLRHYYRMISGADIAIGKIRQALVQRELDGNTVIIFSSDNGYLIGEHGLSSKWLMYEESIRVPMLIADPRLPADARGRTCEEMALNIDIAPTILELADVPAPLMMQGRSLLALLGGNEPPFRDDWFYEHHFRTKRHAIERSEGVRTRRWKYIRYMDQRPHYEQLFDLEADPVETQNLATLSEHRDTLEQLRSRWVIYRRTLE